MSSTLPLVASLIVVLLPTALAARPPLARPHGQAQLHRRATACCWEGQAWDRRARACVGAPTCPPGRDAVETPGAEAARDGRPVARDPASEIVDLAGLLDVLSDGPR